MVMTLSDIVKDGIAQARLGYYRDAVEQFSRAIQLDRTCTKAFYNRGCGYRDLGKHQAALEDFSAAIRLDPLFVNAYINRGNIYRALGNLNAALEDFNQALSIQPTAIKAFSNRGRVKLDLEDYGGAIARFFHRFRAAGAVLQGASMAGFGLPEAGSPRCRCCQPPGGLPRRH